MNSTQYQLINGVLFRKNYDRIILCCLEKKNVDKVIKEMHDGPVGGHFSGETIAHKIL
jgi:hypothetical protein